MADGFLTALAQDLGNGDLRGLSWLFSLFAFAVSMSATPGPNNAMVASSGATFGLMRTLPHILGVSFGFPIMLLAVALGAGELLRAYPAAHAVMRWIGAAYLVWLAWRIAVSPIGRGEADATVPRARAVASGRPLNFIEAALFQWINPKAWVIAIGAVVLAQVLILSIVFLLVCIPCLTLWTGIGAGAARLLRTPRGLRAFNLAMAALLIASLVPLLGEG